MIRRPPRSKRTDTLFPYTTLFRSTIAANYTYLDAGEQRVSGAAQVREVRRAKHSANLIVDGSVGPVTLGGSLAYVGKRADRSEEHTSELQSLMRISYAVFSLKQKKKNNETISLDDKEYQHNR